MNENNTPEHQRLLQSQATIMQQIEELEFKKKILNFSRFSERSSIVQNRINGINEQIHHLRQKIQKLDIRLDLA